MLKVFHFFHSADTLCALLYSLTFVFFIYRWNQDIANTGIDSSTEFTPKKFPFIKVCFHNLFASNPLSIKDGKKLKKKMLGYVNFQLLLQLSIPRVRKLKTFNPFQTTVPILYPPITLAENLWFSNLIRGYRNGTLAWNGLLSLAK